MQLQHVSFLTGFSMLLCFPFPVSPFSYPFTLAFLHASLIQRAGKGLSRISMLNKLHTPKKTPPPLYQTYLRELTPPASMEHPHVSN